MKKRHKYMVMVENTVRDLSGNTINHSFIPYCGSDSLEYAKSIAASLQRVQKNYKLMEGNKVIEEGRHCGGCTLCCSILGVKELEKPPLQDCPHCEIGKKCNIYSTRPKECIDFDCLWKAGKIPYELDPKKTNVFLSDLKGDFEKIGMEIENNKIIVYSNPSSPTAYKEGKMKDFLNELLAAGAELILVKDGKKLLMKWGRIEDDGGNNL